MSGSFGKALTIAALLLGTAGQRLVAGDTICVGVLTGDHDNVLVPEGATCTLADASAEGNVEVKPSGALIISGETHIRGNVKSDGGIFIRIFGPLVIIGGNLQIKKAREWSGYEPGTRILGNFQYEENDGFLLANGGVIRGDFQMIKNAGGGVISGNTIRKNLQCKENVSPVAGGGNRVSGNREDQCSRL